MIIKNVTHYDTLTRTVTTIDLGADDNVFRCADCTDGIQYTEDFSDRYGVVTNHGWVCGDCSTEYNSCEECGDIHHNDDLIDDHRGYYFCSACAPQSCLPECENKLRVPKQVSKDERHLGFELEACFTRPNHWVEPKETHVQRVYEDSSIHSDRGDSAAEVCTQPTKSFNALKKVLEAMDTAGAYVNDSCGGHIHVDARDVADWYFNEGSDRKDKRMKMARIFTHYQRMLYAISERRRLESNYCYWNRTDGAIPHGRYHALNFEALEKGTLEFRLFSASLDYNELKLRGIVCRAIVKAVSAAISAPGTPPSVNISQEEEVQGLLSKPHETTNYIRLCCESLGLSRETERAVTALYCKYWNHTQLELPMAA